MYGVFVPRSQLDVSLGTITALKLLGNLQQFINNENFPRTVFAKFDIPALQSTVDSAVHHINDTVKADVEVLRIQGKSVQTLFEDAHVPVPPGF